MSDALDHPIDDLAARLERERIAADRDYNDAMTALDRVVNTPLPPLSEHVRDAAAQFPWISDIAAQLQAQAAAQTALQHHLMGFLQKITGYVESRDRAIGGSELRDEIVRSRARVLEVERAVEQLASQPLTAAGPAAPSAGPAASSVTGAGYIGFEDQFRGSREEIRRRQTDYMPLFAGAANVLDVGCGRGELLDLFREHGISARGVDSNAAMVAACRERGLTADTGDGAAYLEQLPDGSLGGLIALQVVEHLEPRVLVRFLETAFLKLKPGAPIVLETINAACWMAFFETYIRDLTHTKPLHPDTLKFLVTASGFSHADVRFRAPVEANDRLPRIDETSIAANPALAEVIAAVNGHADRLNARLFSSMDYAVIARR